MKSFEIKKTAKLCNRQSSSITVLISNGLKHWCKKVGEIKIKLLQAYLWIYISHLSEQDFAKTFSKYLHSVQVKCFSYFGIWFQAMGITSTKYVTQNPLKVLLHQTLLYCKSCSTPNDIEMKTQALWKEGMFKLASELSLTISLAQKKVNLLAKCKWLKQKNTLKTIANAIAITFHCVQPSVTITFQNTTAAKVKSIQNSQGSQAMSQAKIRN